MKLIRSLCAGLLSIVAGGAMQTVVFANDGPAFNEGMENYNNHRFHAASDSFQKALAKDPNNAKTHYYLGLCFEALMDPDSAKSEYEMAFQINPFSEQG